MRTKDQVKDNLSAIKANYREVFKEELPDEKIKTAVLEQIVKLKEKYLVDHRVKLYTIEECFMALEVLDGKETAPDDNTNTREVLPVDGRLEKPTAKRGRSKLIRNGEGARPTPPREGSPRVVLSSQKDEDDGFESFPRA